MRSLGVDVTDKELQQMVEEVDDDGSAQIEFDEFLDMMVGRP